MDNTKPKLSLEYIAGFMDGEGTFTIVKHTSSADGYLRFNVSVTVGSTYKPVLEGIIETIGVGKIYNVKQMVNKRFYSLEFRKRSDVITICQALIPFLVEKRQQAEVLLEFCLKREQKFAETKNNRYSKYDDGDLVMFQRIKELKYA